MVRHPVVKKPVQRLLQLQFIGLMAVYTFLGLTPSPEALGLTFNDLLMHWGGYLVAGLSICLAFLPKHPYGRMVLWLFCYSLVIEILQYFIPNRGFSTADLAANLLGISMGVGLFACLKTLWPQGGAATKG